MNDKGAVLIEACSLGKTLTTPTCSLKILSNINMKVHVGESVAIVGESGSGKTTLLGLLGGLDSPTAGDCLLFGESIDKKTEDERALLRAERVGFVFQSFHLLDNLTALENVSLPLDIFAKPNSQELAKAALTEVGLEERMDHYPRQLSGGEQQRVALARAFIDQPKLILADEPTGNLDENTGQQMTELLFSLIKQHQTSLVMVTHNMALAAQCDSQYRLHKGQLVA